MKNLIKYPIVLSIAGSDCSGGAGIQADLKAISALGAYAATAITAITVQNTMGVKNIFPIPLEFVKGQIEATMEDLQPDAIKIGMVNDSEIVKIIAQCIRKYNPRWVIYDPVMVSTSGYKLIEDNTINIIKEELFPLATLITPNLCEAEILCGREINTLKEMQLAAKELLQWESKAVLLKGGHLKGEEMTDVLQMSYNPQQIVFKAIKTETKNTHGTGCTLSSAIAALLAGGLELEEAVKQAKEYVSKGIKEGADIHIGEGYGPLNHFFAPVSLKKIKKTED